MEMLCIPFSFIRAQRNGLLELQLYAFHRMLQFFDRYDHTNYARWGGVELAEMHLPHKEVKDDLYHGNCVDEGSDEQCNQINPEITVRNGYRMNWTERRWNSRHH